MAFGSVFDAFWHPEKIIACRQPSYGMMIRTLPLWIQCSLLHRRFAHSTTLRWLRLFLAPINFYLALSLSVEYCYTPLTKRGMLNLGLGVWSAHLATKSLEWGFTSGFWDGRSWTALKPGPSSTTPSPSSLSMLAKGHDWNEVARWTTELFFSFRGLQYGWGPKNTPQRQSLPALIRRIFLLNTVMVSSVAFLVLSRDKGSPTAAFAALGVADFWPRTILAEGLATLSFGLLLITALDITFSFFFLITYGIRWLGSHVYLPQSILDFCNPDHCYPLYNFPHTATSLSWFWGNGWHQLFRRNFLFCGAFPASALARKLGAGLSVQRLCGLFGSFLVSALLHEYVIHVVARKPHPFPHLQFTEFPASFIYFLVQPVGIILEPYIIPHIPRWAGGGWLWVLVFTLVTATPFRRQYVENMRLVDQAYRPLNEWTLWTILIPGNLMKI